MDFRHLIVTCLFSKLRLPFDNQKVKENYAIFSKKNKNFFKKITSFFKSVLVFLPLPGVLLYSVEICTLFASKKQERPILRQVGIV